MKEKKWVYVVWDIQTGSQVGRQVAGYTLKREYLTRKAASRAADRLNLEYGAHRYAVDYVQQPSSGK